MLIAVILVLASLHLWSLMRWPPPFVDEAWFASRAWSLARSGDPIGSLDRGVVDTFEGSHLFFPFLPVAVQATALQIAGGPSLRALRMLSLAFGLLLAAAVWTIASTLFGFRTALLSVVLLTLSLSFVGASHLARHDVMASAVGFTGIAIHVWNRMRFRSAAITAGLLTGLSIEVHPFALVVVVGLLSLAAAEYGVSLFRDPMARGLLFGLAAGLAVFPAIHVLPDPAAYFELGRIIYGPSHVPRAAELVGGLVDAAALSSQTFLLGFVPALCAWITLLLSSDRRERTIALLTGSVFIAFALLVRNKLGYYSILITPALALCVACGVRKVLLTYKSPALRAAIHMVLLGYFIFGASLTILALKEDHRRSLTSVQRRLRLVIRPQESIMGSQTYWFGFSEQAYYSWEQLIYLQRAHSGMSMTAALARMRPDIFIRDRHLDEYIRDDDGSSTYTRLLRLPKSELESCLSNRATLVADFDGGVYGRVRVYRLRWESQPDQ